MKLENMVINVVKVGSHNIVSYKCIIWNAGMPEWMKYAITMWIYSAFYPPV